MITQTELTRFNDYVLSKYQIYNSIFTTLPFDKIKRTGALLPLFEFICKNGFSKGKNPTEIVTHFFNKYVESYTEKKKINLLFRFVQYIERQVVLFDAVEEAAFPIMNNMDGIGTLRNSTKKAELKGALPELKRYLKNSKVRVVLTAHPTQFYPSEVLTIITDLSESIENNNYVMTKKLLAQLGKTPFFKKEKPSPFDEAVSLIWYLEHIFYHSIADIYRYISDEIFDDEIIDNPILEVGFWPGGDRDGNPFVTTEITLQVAMHLRQSLLRSYHKDFQKLKRRLTFKEVSKTINSLERTLYKATLNPEKQPDFTSETLIKSLERIGKILQDKHHSLFIDELKDLMNKIKLFGFHFAILDIRQDSSIHEKIFDNLLQTFPGFVPENYQKSTDNRKLDILSGIDKKIDINRCTDEMLVRTLESMQAIKTIQKRNGEKGANRYVISNTHNALDIIKVFVMLRSGTFGEKMPVDIVPLFETVNDLQNAGDVMNQLYQNITYRKHLEQRGNKQSIMLGFSDGTKDGGYLMANWGIYQAKEKLTEVARKNGVKVIFFDGRGGPPARGGGKTHQFYASFGNNIEHDEIQLTVQGQSISSHYGTLASAQYNLEQLLSAGIDSVVSYKSSNELSDDNRIVMDELARLSYDEYSAFKKHPKFLSYLEKMSTLMYYGKTNIGSRPSKRNQSDTLVFSALRAIPFVGSWSQLKQNVPGFFGVGSAIKKYEDADEFYKVQQLYTDSDFFKTLIENSMMSLNKSFFELTAYMRNDKEYGDFWQLIYSEYKLTKRLLLKVTGQKELMENYPASKASIAARERIVLPLLTIQQYALQQIQKLRKLKSPDTELLETYEKLVVRSLYGNINASRNSA